jgi:hypothetical protein
MGITVARNGGRTTDIVALLGGSDVLGKGFFQVFQSLQRLEQPKDPRLGDGEFLEKELECERPLFILRVLPGVLYPGYVFEVVHTSLCEVIAGLNTLGTHTLNQVFGGFVGILAFQTQLEQLTQGKELYAMRVGVYPLLTGFWCALELSKTLTFFLSEMVTGLHTEADR